MEAIKIGSLVVVRGAPFGFTKRPAYALHLGDISCVIDISRIPDDEGAGVLCCLLSDNYFYSMDVLDTTTPVAPAVAPVDYFHAVEPPTPTEVPKACNVTRPSHYNQGKIECLDAMVEAFGGDAVRTYARINAFKYLWRSEYKNGDEDLKKAIFYLTLASGTDPRRGS